MRVIIAGGGTGGHVFPGLAIAEELKKRHKDVEITFVGTEQGIEARIIPREGYSIKFLRADKFVGMSILRKLKGICGLFISIMDSCKMFRELKPDVVIGVGGYASVAPVFTAFIRSIPNMIVEQNSVPGLANKILGKFTGAIGVTYQESISYFPKQKTYLTGNPIRERILKGSKEAAYSIFSLEKNKFTIFIFGGSLGARSINMAMIEAFGYMTDIKNNVQFLHQTGERDYEYIREAYRKWGMRGTVVPFIFQMAEAYAVSDIVISRAGATTLAELTAVGKPSILIPYPHAAGFHQDINATKLYEMKAAKMILDKQLKGELLAANIKELFLNQNARQEMEKYSRAFGRPDAAQKIVDIAMSLRRMSAAKSHSKGEK
ncbi:MAG: undecaprenyldiphospho-muramoylpentapeptide beta-N-acetylglucosaminyltransferase [Nitrospiraceae bacterium]|nr:undecaprenyldiphospho-muramoylpentapeptide beta-N-acetylglucosaminyltransferase [Nitrospiraceae bacterium]